MATDKPLTSRPKSRNAIAVQRVHDAWAMRVRGAGWDEIALALGYANAPNAVRAVRNYVGKLPEPSAPELRSMWRERLEMLWPLAVRDVEKGRPGGTRAAVAIAQRAAALDGLDAPTRVQIGPGDERFEDLVAAFLRSRGVSPVVEAEVVELEVLDVEEDPLRESP